MQKCIVISTPDARFSALVFRGDFKDSIKRVAELGFDAVELAIRRPAEVNVVEINKLLKEYDLTVPALGTGQAFGQEGLSFTDPDAGIRRRAVRRIKEHLDLSQEISRPQVIIGLIRGIVRETLSREKAEGYFIECMQECADYNPDVVLTIEPLNRYETNLYNTLQSTAEVITRINRSNVRMLIDTFHMNIEEADILRSIEGVKELVSHVHLADSNRWAPGCGHIDFPSLFNKLEEIGYRGALSAEILPEPDPEESARLTMEFFKKIDANRGEKNDILYS